MAEIIAIAAIGKNRELGRNNDLLWKLSTDLDFFKKTTLNHPVVMGKKTYLSIGKPLPKRVNIVLSKENFNEKGIIVAHSKEEALKLAKEKSDKVFIIGGAQIYKLFLPETDTLLLTQINAEADADVYFPEFEHIFEKVQESPIQKENGLEFSFTTWKKKA